MRAGGPTKAPRVSRRAVAALFLERQHLDRPRARRLTAASLTRFVEDAGGLQLDTINVVDRAHHLTLWSRFGPYDRAALDRMVYRRRTLFEYWAHAACLVAASHGPAWRRVMLEYATRPRHGAWQRWVKKNRAVIGHVLEEIRARGPLSNADFEHDRRGRRAGWWEWKPQTHALHYLWMSGQIAVHSRAHFQKRYDLAERVLPALFAAEPPEAEAFRRWHVRRSLRAMGAATESDLRMYLTFPGITIAERRRTLEAMVRDGEVVEVALDDGRGPKAERWLALSDDLPALAGAARRRAASRGTTLLSPFDSLLWYRERVRRLFGYDYKIEVYVPAPKRRHGYYSLPILHDGHLIGRLDPKTWREQRRLEVRSVHFEPWFASGSPPPAAAWGRVDRDAALGGLSGALVSLGTFVGADHVTLGRVSPSSLAAPLKRALRATTGR